MVYAIRKQMMSIHNSQEIYSIIVISRDMSHVCLPNILARTIMLTYGKSAKVDKRTQQKNKNNRNALISIV
jgi:hypothetical protein